MTKDKNDKHSLSMKIIILRIVIIISMVEFAIMLFFSMANLQLTTVAEAVLDAVLLSVVSAPFIYFWVINPFISARLQAEEKIRHLSLHDTLTELPNRRHLEIYMDRAIKQAERDNTEMALFYMDLDGFKAVNDELSHEAGDLVLVEIAKKFNQHIRENEFIARIGGDEFCLIVTHFSEQDELKQAAERIIKNCSGTLNIAGMKVEIGLSVGISVYPHDGKNYRELCSQADMAMYSVKTNGKGDYCFA